MVQQDSKSNTTPAAGEPALTGLLHGFSGENPAEQLAVLVQHGADQIPLPGSGRTLERWRGLAAVGSSSLGLAKLYEGHTDALAILAEIDGAGVPAGSSWGVWCAELPGARVQLRQAADGRHVLDGRKAWCSGAKGLSHALISCWNEDGQACLASVALSQPGVHVTDEGWQAVGTSPEGLKSRLKDETALLDNIIQTRGIKIE